MNYDNIGKNINKLREKSNISQKQLATFLKVDQSLISKIEKNQRNITTDLLEKISSLFGVESNTFFCENLTAQPISFSFRTNGITSEDLETISYINKIALNLKSMTDIKKDSEV